jgi:predicted membrane protein
MSEWENRRKRSLPYYLCLMIMLWPVFLIPLNLLFAVEYMSLNALIEALFISAIATGLVFGCGSNYGYRGINPPSRNILNYNDNKYAETFGVDETDHP